MLIALGVGFGVGGLVMKLPETFCCARPRRRETARPIPDGLPIGRPPLQRPIADQERGPNQDGIEIDPARLRQLLDHRQDLAGAHK
jgi:hypothetical protein